MTCSPQPPPKQGSSFVKILLIIIAACLVTACGENSSAPSRAEAPNSSGAIAPSQPAAEVIPYPERAFIYSVSVAQRGSAQAANDMQRGGIKATRDEAICALFSGSFSVDNWIGTVKKIDSNSDGKGVMGLSIADRITVKTWNNELSDIGDNTLIEPNTELFRAASMLKEGQGYHSRDRSSRSARAA